MSDNVVPIVREGVENRSATVTLDIWDGTYVFAMRWGEIITLQEERDAGPYLILDRLVSGKFLVQDVSSVIRLGLIGGGMAPAEALKKVRTYVEARPVMEFGGAGAEDLSRRPRRRAGGGSRKKTRGGKSGRRDEPLANGKIRFAAIYGNGAVLGFSPGQVDAMSVWQYLAALDGYNRANDPDSDKKLSDKEQDELFEWITKRNG